MRRPWRTRVSSMGSVCAKHAPEDRRIWSRYGGRGPRHRRAAATRRVAREPRPHAVVVVDDRSMGAQATDRRRVLTRNIMTAGRAAARTPKSPEQRKVSLWLAVKKTSIKKMQGVDILKDLCGVRHYDLDSQELSAVADDFPKAAVEQVL